ncbi:MAG: DUF1285 domain-containing protein [Pseudomonadota bacterium]
MTAEGLAQSATRLGRRGPPPVHLWDPPYCGALDIRIARDGLWYYLGTPIGRMPLVKLFASILRRDADDAYYLVTPVEKVGITVDDAPFVAVDFRLIDPGPDQRLVFETNVGDEAEAGPEHAIRVVRDAETGEPSPYIHIRARLEALIDRKSFYRLVDIGEEADGWFGVRSAGVFFPIIPAAELEF